MVLVQCRAINVGFSKLHSPRLTYGNPPLALNASERLPNTQHPHSPKPHVLRPLPEHRIPNLTLCEMEYA
jgi:hypothetical protein